MGDYPYPTDYFGPLLPAWPVKYSCGIIINETSKGVDILTAFKDMVGVYYNDSSECFNLNPPLILVIIKSITSSSKVLVHDTLKFQE